MAGRQAKLIDRPGLKRMLAHLATNSADPVRDRVIVLLSVKAGLRAGEIAGLDWCMILDARGYVSDSLSIHDDIAKKGSGRRIPLHPDLRRSLIALRRVTEANGPVICSRRGGPLQANSIVNWFVALYTEVGLTGCSSHSGRRTFITAAARNVQRAGCSLRDVQLLAGHRSIETTQTYIDGNSSGQHRLVSMI